MDISIVSPMMWLTALQLALYGAGWILSGMIVPQERAVVWHWCAHSWFAAFGLFLASQRTETYGWWAYCGSSMLAILSYMSVARGADLLVHRPPRDWVHFGILAAFTVSLLLIGASKPNAALRSLAIYSTVSVYMVYTVATIYRPIRLEFGRRASIAALVVMGSIACMYLLRFLQQASNMSIPREMNQQAVGNVEMLFGYVITAASFNVGVLSLLIKRLVQRLSYLSQRDPLTGLLNRRAFDEKLEVECRRVRRRVTSFVLLAIDIDHFKRINDLYGHAAGDAVLVSVARQLQDYARESDVVARVGGEEFFVMVKASGLRAGQEAAERLRQAVSTSSVLIGGERVSVTISVGVAAPLPQDLEAASLKQRADEVLYLAKAAGRNCVRAQQA
jgi:diguanylate cyclase (GGDEF)-like protein